MIVIGNTRPTSHTWKHTHRKNIAKQTVLTGLSGTSHARSSESVHGTPEPPFDEDVDNPKRPPNAFMLFRSKFAKDRPQFAHIVARLALQTESELQQYELSKSAGTVWHAMTLSERAPFIKRAKEIAVEHRKNYPNFVYAHAGTPKRRRTRRRRRSIASTSTCSTIPSPVASQYMFLAHQQPSRFPEAAVHADPYYLTRSELQPSQLLFHSLVQPVAHPYRTAPRDLHHSWANTEQLTRNFEAIYLVDLSPRFYQNEPLIAGLTSTSTAPFLCEGAFPWDSTTGKYVNDLDSPAGNDAPIGNLSAYDDEFYGSYIYNDISFGVDCRQQVGFSQNFPTDEMVSYCLDYDLSNSIADLCLG